MFSRSGTLRFVFAVALSVLMIHVPRALADEWLTVTDDSGAPIANAAILLGHESGDPFPGNSIITDGSGSAPVPTEWKAALPLTVQAAGYITKTVPGAEPGTRTIHLTRQEPASQLEVAGTTAGFGRLASDGWVDFAMVLPAIKREQMLAFDMSTIISPYTDSISVIGREVKIPSNLTLPRQQESYVLPITLDKPDYRVYVRSPGNYRIAATHGRFPLQQVVDEIRAGKSFFDVINYFDFLESGDRTVAVNRNLRNVNINVNGTPFGNMFNVRAPRLASGQIMLGLSLLERDGLFIPADVKRLNSGENVNLGTTTRAGTPTLFAVVLEKTRSNARRDEGIRAWFAPLLDLSGPPPVEPEADAPDFNKMSMAVMPVAARLSPIFLPLTAQPALTGDVLTLHPPSISPGLIPAGMYLTLAEVEEINTGNLTVERRTRQWEIWTEGWLTHLELPKVRWTRRPNRKYRWDVNFLARPANFTDDLTTISHATRNSVEI